MQYVIKGTQAFDHNVLTTYHRSHDYNKQTRGSGTKQSILVHK